MDGRVLTYFREFGAFIDPQLVAGESRLEEERSRNDLLSARLKRETLRCIDLHNWGLEPGVGL